MFTFYKIFILIKLIFYLDKAEDSLDNISKVGLQVLFIK